MVAIPGNMVGSYQGQFAPVAQGIERWPPEPKVRGSIPLGRASCPLRIMIKSLVLDEDLLEAVDSDLSLALSCLREGKLVGFPTETVYGLGADALNPAAVARVFAAKGRPQDHPLIVHLASIQALDHWASQIPASARNLAQAFWPGPLTLVLPKAPRVPEVVTGGLPTVALRVPNHPLALALLNAFGSGLVGPSANRYQRISPTEAKAVYQELGTQVACVLDGGPCRLGIESTVVACEPNGVRVLRLGTISIGELRAVLGPETPLYNDAQEAQKQRMPGSDLVHYAPEKPVFLGSPAQIVQALMSAKDVGNTQELGNKPWVFSFEAKPQVLPAELHWQTLPKDPGAYAQGLYRWLRAFDQSSATLLWIERVPKEEAWFAIADRLNRASV